jgi:hypothetical protein
MRTWRKKLHVWDDVSEEKLQIIKESFKSKKKKNNYNNFIHGLESEKGKFEDEKIILKNQKDNNKTNSIGKAKQKKEEKNRGDIIRESNNRRNNDFNNEDDDEYISENNREEDEMEEDEDYELKRMEQAFAEADVEICLEINSKDKKKENNVKNGKRKDKGILLGESDNNNDDDDSDDDSIKNACKSGEEVKDDDVKNIFEGEKGMWEDDNKKVSPKKHDDKNQNVLKMGSVENREKNLINEQMNSYNGRKKKKNEIQSGYIQKTSKENENVKGKIVNNNKANVNVSNSKKTSSYSSSQSEITVSNNYLVQHNYSGLPPLNPSFCPSLFPINYSNPPMNSPYFPPYIPPNQMYQIPPFIREDNTNRPNNNTGLSNIEVPPINNNYNNQYTYSFPLIHK